MNERSSSSQTDRPAPAANPQGKPFARHSAGGGRRAEAAEAIRSRLLDAAETLLAERQPATITSRDIARRAGASDGVLYNHFADKHELLITALVRRFEGLIARFAASSPTPGERPVADNVAELVRRSHELQLAALPMLANLAGDPPLLHRFLVEIHRPPLGGDAFHRPIVEYLAGERRLGRVGPVDPEAVADVVVGAVLLQGLIDVLGHRPPAESAARGRGVIDTILAALAPISDHAAATPSPDTDRATTDPGGNAA